MGAGTAPIFHREKIVMMNSGELLIIIATMSPHRTFISLSSRSIFAISVTSS